MYITDFEKIEYLRNNKYFGQAKQSKLKDNDEVQTTQTIIADIKFKCINYFLEEIDPENEQDDFILRWDKSNKTKDITTLIDLDCLDKKEQTYFINLYSDICTFLFQKIEKKNKSTNFIINISTDNLTSSKFKYIKRAINELTGITQDALDVATNLEEFIILLDEPYGEVPDLFQEFKLRDKLIENDESDDLIGLYDFENNLNLPSLIDDTVLNDKNLYQNIFIEGISGSGKTVLGQSIAYNISKYNSYYMDLSKDLNRTFNFHDDIELFIQTLSDVNGTVILDNFQHTSGTKVITRYFLKIASKYNLKIILITQFDIFAQEDKKLTYYDQFFQNEEYLEVKQSMYYIELSNRKSQSIARLSMIESFLTFCTNKGIIDNQYNSLVIANKLEKEFGCLLLYIKYAIANNKDLDITTIGDIKELILDKYKLLIDFKKNKRFKILLILFASRNIPLAIFNQDYKNNYMDEYNIINKLIKKKLIYKASYSNYFILTFSNNAIPNQLTDYIIKKEKKDIDKIIFKYLQYIIDTNHYLLVSLIEYYISNNDIELLDCLLTELAVSNKLDIKNIISLDLLTNIIDKYELLRRDQDIPISLNENHISKNDIEFFDCLSIDIIDKYKLLKIEQDIPNWLYDIIEPIINRDYTNLNIQSFYNLTYVFNMHGYEDYVELLIYNYYTDENILCSNIDIIINILHYLKYTDFKTNPNIYTKFVDKIVDNQDLFIINLSDNEDFKLSELIDILLNLNDEHLTDLISSNLHRILETPVDTLILQFVKLEIVQSLHNKFNLASCSNIMDNILGKIDYNTFEVDILNFNTYTPIINLIILYEQLDELSPLKELLSDIYTFLDDKNNTEYLEELIRSIIKNDNEAFSTYLLLLKNIPIKSLKYKVENIINTKVIISEYIISNKDAWRFILNENHGNLSDIKHKFIALVSSSKLLINLNISTSIFGKILKYADKHMDSYFNLIFTKLEQNTEKLTLYSSKDNYYSEVFDFFNICQTYKKTNFYILDNFFNKIFSDERNMITAINGDLTKLNKFLIYLQKHDEYYQDFMSSLSYLINKYNLNKIFNFNITNQEVGNIPLYLFYINEYTNSTIKPIGKKIETILLPRFNLELDTNKLSFYTLQDILNSQSVQIQDYDELTLLMKALEKFISSDNSVEQTFIQLKGLISVTDNQEFLQNIKTNPNIKTLKMKYKEQKTNFSPIQIKICNKIIEILDNI